MLHRALTLTLLWLALPLVAAAEIPIIGQVLEPGGEPRAKAQVRLEPIPPTYERAVLRLNGKPGPEPVARTRTDAEGTFELAAPEAGMWKVVVTAPDMLTVEYRLIPLVEAAVLPTVNLAPAADLEVHLKDAEGKPRPGRIGAVSLGVRNDRWRPQLRLATAGEDGVAHLPLGAPTRGGEGEKIQLEVLAEGHPLAVFELYDETSVTIDLKPGGARTVRVTDNLRRPLADAIAFQGSALLPLGLSDEQGHLSLVLQTDEIPAVRVSTADRWNGGFGLHPKAKSDKMKDLQLDPPATIRGRVLDLSNRDPVAGALVWAVRGEMAITDEQGRYALEEGVYKARRMQAAAAGYQPGHSQRDQASPNEAPAIALAPAGGLSGKVVDQDGALLKGVAIVLAVEPTGGRLNPAIHRMMRDGWRGRSSDGGVFRVTGLPSGIGFKLTFEHPGFAPGTLEVEPLEPFERRSGLRVVLEPGRLAFGRVVDEDDVPIAGAEVRLEAPPPTNDPMVVMHTTRWQQDQPEEPAHLTDGEGRFEIADLAAGKYDMEVYASGFAPARVPGLEVAEADGKADFGTVVLVPGAAIEGRVSDSDGGAIAEAEVAVDPGRQGFAVIHRPDDRIRTKTDAKGRFVVADLLPGQQVTLVVTKKGYGSQTVPSLRPPTAEPLAIVLEAAGRIKGRVVDKQGDPVHGANVMTRSDFRAMRAASMVQRGGRPTWARSKRDGTFLIEDVEPGTLHVSVDADDYQRLVRDGVELVAGGEIELELVLDAGAVVEGTVTTADGEPLVQASIMVSEPLEGFTGGNLISADGQTDVDGRYRVAGAPIGPARITVHHDSGQQLEKGIEVRPGTNVVDLVIERGFEVSGQVVAPDGAPMAGASLSIQQATQPGLMHFSYGNSPQARSKGDGTFTLTGIKVGRYVVTASRDGYAPARSETFEVKGDVAGILLQMSTGTILKGRILGLEFDELGALSLVAYSEHGMRQGRVDFEAGYAFESLASGLWHLQAQVGGSGRSTSLQVEIPDGVPEVLRDIEFGGGFTLTGIVLDGGEPLAGANVTASSMNGSSGFAPTGDDGRFRIEGLKAGSFHVMVMAGFGGMQHMETLELAGDHELRIEISTGSLSGRIRDLQGEPLSGVAVALERLDVDDSLWGRQLSSGNRTESDSSGVFRMPRVRQGNWRVIATKAGFAPGEATVTVAGDASPEIEIRLTPTEGVTFEVALESDIPIPAVQVTMLDAGGRQLASGSHSVIDGRVRVSTVPPGRWQLVIQGGDSAATRFEVDSPGDQGRLLLRTGGTLHIRVPELEEVQLASVKLTGPDGQPFVSAMGVAFGPGEWMLSAGQSMIPGLVPGVWSFTVTHEDRTWSGSAAVTAGETTEVSLP